MAQSVEQLYLVPSQVAPDANGTPIGTGAPPGKVHIEQGTVQEEVCFVVPGNFRAVQEVGIIRIIL